MFSNYHADFLEHARAIGSHPGGLLDRTVPDCASKYLANEKAKANALANYGIKVLLEEKGSYGTRDSRAADSTVITFAATRAIVEEDGMSMIPFQGSLLCECQSKMQHLDKLIQDVCLAMCEKLDEDDDLKTKEEERLMLEETKIMIRDVLRREGEDFSDDESEDQAEDEAEDAEKTAKKADRANGHTENAGLGAEQQAEQINRHTEHSDPKDVQNEVAQEG